MSRSLMRAPRWFARVANIPERALITRPTNCRSPLRHSGDAHALKRTFASGEISPRVARRAGSVAAEGEGRIEHEARLRSGPRPVAGGGERPARGKNKMTE